MEDEQLSGGIGVSGNLHRALDDEERTLLMLRREGETRRRREGSVGVEHVRKYPRRRAGAEEGTGDEPHARAVAFDERERGGRVMSERRRGLLVAFGERDPGLNAGKPRSRQALLGIAALGMDDAAPGRHPVHVTPDERLHGPEAV